MEIVIVGAEIGGLAAAHLLGRGGHRVTVVGEAGRLRTSGAAVSLWFSGATVLPRLTVGAETTGAPTGRLLQGSTDGRIMFDLDASRLAARFGASSLLSPRADGWFLRRAALPSPVLTSVFGTYLRAVSNIL
jgi:2-polyprenyl-6-methoxyphenol hydroxylase-like FAD-dependent oxidoreductase